jgi:hypothetical protein
MSVSQDVSNQLSKGVVLVVLVVPSPIIQYYYTYNSMSRDSKLKICQFLN